jgi:quinol monooxygenase YgiN
MAAVWTQGTYKVKAGHVERFVNVWHELAEHAVAEFGARAPTMLRDREDPHLLITFGAWESLEALDRFRASPLVQERTPELGELVEHAEAGILDEVRFGDRARSHG